MPRTTRTTALRVVDERPSARARAGAASGATPAVDALIAGSTSGMGYLDAGLRFAGANSALSRAFGVEDLTGLALRDLQPGGARTADLVRGVFETGRAVSIDAVVGRVSYFRVLDDAGEPLGVGALAVRDSDHARHRARLERAAVTDGLTGLINHRGFQEQLRSEVPRARRHGRALSLAMIDIDGFKQLNDTLGHQAGDSALRRVAARLAAGVRTNDLVARVGGDEFAVLLPETVADEAAVVIERVRDGLRSDAAAPGGGECTISAGICDLGQADTPDELLRYADGALYWAKANGRDVVCQYTPETVEDLSLEQRGDRLLRNKALAGVRTLARAIDAKDHSTLLHSERVASLAARLAEADGWSAAAVAALRETALIHDVGKIGVPREILLKAGPLTRDEYEVVKRHALLGAVIAVDALAAEQLSWLRGHHERWDGSGYPDGLAGHAIPEGAQLLALADAWDVMTSERAYSRTMSTTQAIAECQRCAGSHFNPAVVALLTGPGFERVLRIFANEQATRDRNEQRLAGDHASVFSLHCECGTEGCPLMIEIPAAEYRAVRQTDRRYIVGIGHELPEVEETLRTTAHYAIVEKG